MNILVTGSSGYVGRSFITQFENDYDFKTFSLLSDRFESINFNTVDAIVHCAALVHQKIECSYEKYLHVNVEYPLSLAKEAKKNGVKQFVFISTIAVYGDSHTMLKENTTCKPITSYGKSKLEAESELLKLQDDNFIVSIIRPPMVYGKDAPGNIVSLINVIKRVSLLPFGKISNRRSFIYIGNLCHLINEVIVQNKSGVFLASDDKAISTTELIKLIALGLNKKVVLIKIPFFESFLKLIKPLFHKRLYESLEIDNKQTIKNLDLKNPYSVEEGIKFMVQGENK